jgi:hypothetical protein
MSGKNQLNTSSHTSGAVWEEVLASPHNNMASYIFVFEIEVET